MLSPGDSHRTCWPRPGVTLALFLSRLPSQWYSKSPAMRSGWEWGCGEELRAEGGKWVHLFAKPPEAAP